MLAGGEGGRRRKEMHKKDKWTLFERPDLLRGRAASFLPKFLVADNAASHNGIVECCNAGSDFL